MLVLYTQCVCIFITGTLLHHFFDVSLQARSWENIGERRLGIQEFDEGMLDHMLHLKHGFFQVPVAEKDRPKTAFVKQTLISGA